MRHPRTAALSASLFAALVAAAPAAAAPATVVVSNDSFSPSSVSINSGEAVTWDVQEGGHNIDIISGPEMWKSTTGKDAKGTQVTKVLSQAGTYKYICDYHGSMKGTITVASAAPQPGGGGSPQPQPGGGAPQPTTGGGSAPAAGAPAAGPAGQATASAVDAAAPAVKRLSVSRSALRVNLSEPAKLTIRFRKQGARKVGKKVVSGHQGANAIQLAKLMRSGRYSVSVVATDAAGNTSKALRLTVRR